MADEAASDDDPQRHRRWEIFKTFFAATRPVIDEIIDEAMAEWAMEVEKREDSLRWASKTLAKREKVVEEAMSKQSDRADALADREVAVREREAAVAKREQQLAAELEKMQAIKSSLVSLFNGRVS